MVDITANSVNRLINVSDKFILNGSNPLNFCLLFLPSWDSGWLRLTCNQDPQGHVGSNPTGGSINFVGSSHYIGSSKIHIYLNVFLYRWRVSYDRCFLWVIKLWGRLYCFYLKMVKREGSPRVIPFERNRLVCGRPNGLMIVC